MLATCFRCPRWHWSHEKGVANCLSLIAAAISTASNMRCSTNFEAQPLITGVQIDSHSYGLVISQYLSERDSPWGGGDRDFLGQTG